MSKQDKEIRTVEDYTEALMRHMVVENLKLLGEEEKKLGPKYTGHLYASFLASYIGGLVYKSLHKNKSVSAESFLRIRDLIEEAVAAGFSGAVAQSLKTKTEFYCQVKTVPEPQSKEIN